MKQQSPRSSSSNLPMWQPPLWRNDSTLELKSSHSKASLMTGSSSRAELHEVSSKASTEFLPQATGAEFAYLKKQAARAVAEKVNRKISSASNSVAAGRSYGGTGGTGDVPLAPRLSSSTVHRPRLSSSTVHRSKSTPNG
eukprot:TRINITY_DN3261_c0_g1_i1.p1 TRINITY_DN3261_c0_g1~~TRINITY_DN3261_c0_g1_i1.p1  ORF type:complete len:140 (-),score=25.53 TRINITY_DN3261_c0_g1_i1:240-659(-)